MDMATIGTGTMFRTGGPPDVDFARTMTVEHKVAAIPPSVFYHDQTDARVLRFCFAKTDETLKEAAEKLCKI